VISLFGGKSAAPGKPLIREIAKSNFRISGLQVVDALLDENLKIPIPEIINVRSMVLFPSQSDVPDQTLIVGPPPIDTPGKTFLCVGSCAMCLP
jgi:hypothetical protein